MVGGFTFDLWLSQDEYNQFVEKMSLWKTPNNNDNGMYIFYDTPYDEKWDRPEYMIDVDCRQIVAYSNMDK